MIKLWKKMVQWYRGRRYFLQYTKDTLIDTLDKDRRALTLAIKYPITQEDSRKLIDVADAIGILDSTVDKLVHTGSLMGYDRVSFALDMMMILRTELRRRR